MNRLCIIGAGGHGRVLADLALKTGYERICFADDNKVGSVLGFDIVGGLDCLEKLNDGKTDFIIGVGDNTQRRCIAQSHKLNWVTLIHPSAQIGINVSIGKGTAVMAGACINTCAFLGEHCIINTCSVVEHDCVLEDFVHLSPSAALGGTVKLGECTHIGIGAAVKNDVSVCRHCIVGAGAAVIKDLKESGTYVGVPVRKIK